MDAATPSGEIFLAGGGLDDQQGGQAQDGRWGHHTLVKVRVETEYGCVCNTLFGVVGFLGSGGGASWSSDRF